MSRAVPLFGVEALRHNGRKTVERHLQLLTAAIGSSSIYPNNLTEWKLTDAEIARPGMQ